MNDGCAEVTSRFEFSKIFLLLDQAATMMLTLFTQLDCEANKNAAVAGKIKLLASKAGSALLNRGLWSKWWL